MTANELRIGNWLNDSRPVNECAKKLFKITDNGYFKVRARDIEVAELFEPIPLTPELLDKCGFVETKTIYIYDRSKELGHHLGDFSICKYDDTQIKVWRGGRYLGIIHCEYLHELQNLYFALTKTELEINL